MCVKVPRIVRVTFRSVVPSIRRRRRRRRQERFVGERNGRADVKDRNDLWKRAPREVKCSDGLKSAPFHQRRREIVFAAFFFRVPHVDGNVSFALTMLNKIANNENISV